MKRLFIFYRELIELTCEFKTPHPGEKEFHYDLKDMRTGFSFSDDSLLREVGNNSEEGIVEFPSDYSEKDRHNMGEFIKFVAEDKSLSSEDRLESMCKKRPFWKSIAFWSLVVAIIAAIATIIGLFI